MTDYILAIDQGTSQTKALIMDRAGTVLATNSAPVRTSIIGETQIEQDPLEIIRVGACGLRAFAGTLSGHNCRAG